MDKIVKIVGSTNLNPTRKLTEKELLAVEQEFLDEAVRLKKTIESRCGRDELNIEDACLILDKMLSPFQYFLTNKVACETLNKQNEREENVKQEHKQQQASV